MGLEQKLGDLGVVTYRLEDLVNWGRTNSMWPICLAWLAARLK
jgi:NADH-quinone oxidoreductase subunit B